MKKIKLFACIFIIILAVLFCFYSNQKALASGVVQLSYASYQPHTSAAYKAQEWWARELEKRSGGKVKIKMFPGQQLAKAKEMLETISSGGADMGGAASAYTPARLYAF